MAISLMATLPSHWGTGRPARANRVPALALILRRQCIPGREGVHVVSPVRDLPVFNLDYRAEPIVVFRACRKDGPMDLVFDDDNTAVVCLVDDQPIGGLKHDVGDKEPRKRCRQRRIRRSARHQQGRLAPLEPD
jgi:hypothetical protein